MTCQKCGASLNENAKFCTACGSNISIQNTESPNIESTATSNSSAQNPYIQQQAYQKTYENQQNRPNPALINNIFRSDTTYKVIAGIMIMLLLWKSAEHISLKRQVNDYNNQDAVEKTIDAADSWLDTVKEALPDSWFGF